MRQEATSDASFFMRRGTNWGHSCDLPCFSVVGSKDRADFLRAAFLSSRVCGVFKHRPAQRFWAAFSEHSGGPCAACVFGDVLVAAFVLGGVLSAALGLCD